MYFHNINYFIYFPNFGNHTYLKKKISNYEYFFFSFFLTGFFADDKSHLSPKIRTIITISSILLLLSFEKKFFNL